MDRWKKMRSWIYRYLSIISLFFFVLSCKMSTVSEMQKNDDNKVNFKISGTKEAGIKVNN